MTLQPPIPRILALAMCLAAASNARAQEFFVSVPSQGRVATYGSGGGFLSDFTAVDHTTPRGVTLGPDGNLYVSYSGSVGSGRVGRFNASTGAFLGDFVGTGSGGLSQPVGLKFGPDGNLYVVDGYSANVKKYNGTTGAPMGDVFAPLLGGLTTAQDIVFQPSTGYMLVSDIAYVGKVNRYDPVTGAFIDVFISSPELDSASGLLLTPTGGVLVNSFDNDKVLLYDGATGHFAAEVVSSGLGGLDRPRGLAFDGAGNLLVMSEGTGEILRYSMTGEPMGVFATLGGFGFRGDFIVMGSVPAPGTIVLAMVGVGIAAGRRRR